VKDCGTSSDGPGFVSRVAMPGCPQCGGAPAGCCLAGGWGNPGRRWQIQDQALRAVLQGGQLQVWLQMRFRSHAQGSEVCPLTRPPVLRKRRKFLARLMGQNYPGVEGPQGAEKWGGGGRRG
jgi:hypothetical protein